MELIDKKNIVVFNKNIPAGVSTILKNIIKFSDKSAIPYKLVLYRFDHEDRITINDNWCTNVVRLKLSKNNNIYHTIKQLRKQITKESIIVAMCAL